MKPPKTKLLGYCPHHGWTTEIEAFEGYYVCTNDAGDFDPMSCWQRLKATALFEHQAIALKERDQAKAQALAELREVLEGEIEKLERPNVAGEDLTSASIRAVKAQGIKDALASLADKEAIDKS